MTPLPHENLLTALGEVSAAFVGFSLVVGILRSRSASSAKEARRFYATREVAENGLLAVGAAFLPLAIHAYGATIDTTWRLASAGFLFFWGLVLGVHMWRRRGVAREGFRTEPIQTALFTVLIAGVAGLLMVNILVGGDSSGARYVTAVLLFLAIVGLLFVYATFSDSENSSSA